jgi:hypothetical protein
MACPRRRIRLLASDALVARRSRSGIDRGEVGVFAPGVHVAEPDEDLVCGIEAECFPPVVHDVAQGTHADTRLGFDVPQLTFLVSREPGDDISLDDPRGNKRRMLRGQGTSRVLFVF